MFKNKTWLRLLLFGLLPLNAFPQGIFITGGARMIMSGPARLVLNNSKFINNGNFIPGTGSVVFQGKGGNGEIVIGGVQTTTFNNITVAISPGTVRLDRDIVINNVLTLQQGNVLLNTHNIHLGTTGKIIGESALSFITDISAAANGKVLATGTLNSGAALQPGNIGIELTANNAIKRVINIERTHAPVNLPNGGQGVRRSFTISSPGILSLPGRARFFYLDPELNGNAENTLILWGTSGAGNFFVPLGKDSSNIVANWVVKNDINMLSAITSAGEGGVVSFNSNSNRASTERGVEESSLRVYPNPVIDKLTLSIFSNDEREAAISITDAHGIKLQQRSVHLSHGKNTIPFNIQSYTAGIYYVSVQTNGLRLIKVIKQ
jgi:hypothetical protein